jgi:hypothetical protein
MFAAPEHPEMAWCGSVRVHAHDRDAGVFDLGGAAFIRDTGRVPDLDDDLTRFGVLAVVRAAWKDQTMHVRIVDAWNAYGEHRGWKYVWCSASEYLTAEVGEHRSELSELAAMLAALEAVL